MIQLRLENVVNASPREDGATPQAGSSPSGGLLAVTAETIARYQVTFNAPPALLKRVRDEGNQAWKMNIGQRMKFWTILERRVAVHDHGRKVV